ncbi:MAG: DUF937 domain-containing protein [Saprospiraceae bacterium]|nr:DUF937 domain-containing protein [Candidatus Opimibacter skivensis]
MNVIELLQGQLDENLIQQLSQHIGAESTEQTEAAASGIISTLVAGLNKNAATPDGATALVSAIDRDHDGSILEDVAGFLLGSRETSNSSTLNGAGYPATYTWRQTVEYTGYAWKSNRSRYRTDRQIDDCTGTYGTCCTRQGTETRGSELRKYRGSAFRKCQIPRSTSSKKWDCCNDFLTQTEMAVSWMI